MCKHHHVIHRYARKGVRSSGEGGNGRWLLKGVEDTRREHPRSTERLFARYTCRRRVEMRRKLDDGDGRVVIYPDYYSALRADTILRRDHPSSSFLPSWRPSLRHIIGRSTPARTAFPGWESGEPAYGVSKVREQPARFSRPSSSCVSQLPPRLLKLHVRCNAASDSRPWQIASDVVGASTKLHE